MTQLYDIDKDIVVLALSVRFNVHIIENPFPILFEPFALKNSHDDNYALKKSELQIWSLRVELTLFDLIMSMILELINKLMKVWLIFWISPDSSLSHFSVTPNSSLIVCQSKVYVVEKDRITLKVLLYLLFYLLISSILTALIQLIANCKPDISSFVCSSSNRTNWASILSLVLLSLRIYTKVSLALCWWKACSTRNNSVDL